MERKAEKQNAKVKKNRSRREKANDVTTFNEEVKEIY